MRNELSRSPASGLLFLIEAVISVIVMTNIWAVADNYYQTYWGRVSGQKYTNVMYISVSAAANGISDSYYDDENDAYATVLVDFIDELSEFGGNISCIVGGNAGDGGSAVYRVYLSADEELSVPIESSESEFSDEAGVYAGNGSLNYVDGGFMNVLSDRLKVIGIMAAYGLEKNTDIYIKYTDLSLESRRYIADYLSENILLSEDGSVEFKIESNKITENEYEKMLASVKSGGDMFRYEIISEDMPESQSAYNGLFKNIKNILLIMSVVICCAVMFQTMLLFMYARKEQILIKKTFGMSNRQIFIPILRQVIFIWVAAAILGMITDVVIYNLIFSYKTENVLKYWFAAISVCAVIAFLIVLSAYLKVNGKKLNLVSELNKVEE